MAPRVAYTQPQAGPQGFARTKKVFGGTVNIATTDLATSAQVAVLKAPAGFVVTGLYAVFPAMDSNGSPTLTVSIGDASSSTRHLNASTTARAGGTVTALASTGLLFSYATDTDILLTATAGAATAVAGAVTVYLEGFMANP